MSRIAAAGFLGLAPAAGLAQECGLAVQASPRVVYAGQRASVSVLASFPSWAYAFASAEFDVYSTHPRWSFVTGGTVAGDDVMNIVAGQAHVPQQGVFANPANPYRVWRGAFTPTSGAAALVEISADPRSFSVYPSVQTSSSVACEAGGGRALLFVNPQRVGKWLAVPRGGTSTTVADDVIVDGRIITGENPASSVGMGLMLATAPAVRETAVRVETDRVPDRFSFGVEYEWSRDVPMETFQLNWTKVESGEDTTGVIVAAGPGGGGHVRFKLYRGLEAVGGGTLPTGEPGGDWTLALPSIPTGHGVVVDGLVYSGESGGLGTMSMVLTYDEPVTAVVRSVSGRVTSIAVDTIDVTVPLAGRPARASATNNLHQLGIGAHVIEATGVERMRVTPVQPE